MTGYVSASLKALKIVKVAWKEIGTYIFFL